MAPEARLPEDLGPGADSAISCALGGACLPRIWQMSPLLRRPPRASNRRSPLEVREEVQLPGGSLEAELGEGQWRN